MSSFGDLKYPADFRHFDYVDPAAPKGGVFSQIGPGTIYNQNSCTFNSLNSYILRGDAAQGMELTFASLMARAGDEPDAMYGLAARAVRDLRRRADLSFRAPARGAVPRWQRADGAGRGVFPDGAEGEGPPDHHAVAARFRGLRGADDATVAVRFAPKRARDVPLFVAGLPIFSRAYYASGRSTNRRSTFRSGAVPTRSARFEAGRYIEYKRVQIGGAPICRSAAAGTTSTPCATNIYRDRDVGFEGFTAKSYLFREEFTSRIWATRYDFPAIKDGRVKRDVMPDDTPSGAQGWFINTRREQIQGSEAARGAGLRLRFRMDQQVHHVRLLRSAPIRCSRTPT